MNDCDLYWLAGILEAEGSFIQGTPERPARILISMQTTDEDVMQKVCGLLGSKYHTTSSERQKQHPNWKTVYGTTLSGLKAVEMMKRLRPLMGKRRGQKIDEALQVFSEKAKTGRYMTDDLVLSILEDNKNGKMTQKKIAEKHGLRRETVNRICKGKLDKWKHLI